MPTDKQPPRGKAPVEKGQTVHFLLAITTELKQAIKKEAHRTFGNRKGAESNYVEMVMRAHLGLNVEGVKEV